MTALPATWSDEAPCVDAGPHVPASNEEGDAWCSRCGERLLIPGFAGGPDPAPATLEEWYDQLVDAAASGNAPAFEQEVARVREFVLADLHGQASDAEDRLLDVLAHCAWGVPIPERDDPEPVP